jgi:hypothetical protein
MKHLGLLVLLSLTYACGVKGKPSPPLEAPFIAGKLEQKKPEKKPAPSVKKNEEQEK